MAQNGPGQVESPKLESPKESAKQEAARIVGRVVGIVPDANQLSEPIGRVRAALENEGYQMSWATPQEVLYGSEALEADAVLMDATLGEGGVLIEHLKRGPQAAAQGSTPAVLVLGDASQVGHLLEIGADDFLTADAAEDEIRARVSLATRLGRAERELQSTREELSHQIQVDDQTGALNRRFFFQAAYRECSRARRYKEALSCLMVEIDHFQLYNTTFGYGCGDFILHEVATILKNSVRDTDLVARFGGSKFVILLTHTDTEGAVAVRAKIENWIKNGRFSWLNQRLPVTVSIGEAERVPGRGRVTENADEDDETPLSTREDLAELLEDADSALYVAKKGARFPTFIESQIELSESQTEQVMR